MAKIIGNAADLIDWKSVITHLEDTHPPTIKQGRPEQWIESVEGVDPNHPALAPWKAYIARLDASNYNFASTLWYAYDPGKHYDTAIDQKMCEFLNITKRWACVHKVTPGNNCPIHIDNDYESNIDHDKKIRFIMQISPSVKGQLFFMENEVCSNMKLGDLYYWDDYEAWHSAYNIGTETMYLYSIEGTKND